MPNMYDAMEFAPYEFREFPAHVYLDDDGKPTKNPYIKRGKRVVPREFVVVQNREELAALEAGGVALVEGKIRSEDDDRRALYLEAERIGAKVDKRWTVEKIAGEIEAHKKALAAS